jgi:hypothetical protein
MSGFAKGDVADGGRDAEDFDVCCDVMREDRDRESLRPPDATVGDLPRGMRVAGTLSSKGKG